MLDAGYAVRGTQYVEINEVKFQSYVRSWLRGTQKWMKSSLKTLFEAGNACVARFLGLIY